MGGYLGRVRLCLPSLTVSTGDLQKRPSPPVHYISRSLQVNSMDEYLNMADSSRSFEDDEALAYSQEHPGRVVVVHMQRYPVEKAWDSLVGVFSSMFLCGQHNSVPTLSASRMPRISMILKVVSTKGRATLRFVLAQPVLIIWSFLTGYLSTQSRKETQMSALQQSSRSKRVQAKKKKDLTTLGKGEGFAKQEEDSPVTTRPSDQGKDSDGDVSAPSAFRRLIVNGVLSSFIPRPGLLGRDICSKNSAKSCIKESQTAFKSSYKRNAIASSYSSTLAQWPSERIRVLDTRGTALGTASGAATGAAAHATREAAADAAAGATRATAAGAAPSTATGTAAGVAPGAAAGVASDAASGAAAGAAPGDAARATQGASPGAASGAATGAFGCATQGASLGIAPGAVPDDVSGAAPSAASGAVADAAPGAVSGDAPGALPLPSPALSQSKAKAAKKGKKKGRAASGNPVPGSVPDDLLLPSPASSQSKTAAKKASEKDPAASGNPKKKGKKNKKKNKKAAATDAQIKQGDPRNGLPAPDIPKPVRRKIPLLLPYRRDVPLILPPPPELCFRITAEDFDLEKKTSMQWINKVLKDDGTKARCN